MGIERVLLLVALGGGIIMAGVLIWQAVNVEKKVISKIGLFSVAIILFLIVDLAYTKAVREGVLKSLWP